MKFLQTIKVEEFKEILNSLPMIEIREENVLLNDAYNRVLSKDIISPIDVPHFRKSRMDGYAVIAQDTFLAEEDNFIELELIETIPAGKKPQKILSKGMCSYVATGASVPEGADGVVMVEFTEKVGDKILISKAIAPGTHIINIGHDIKKKEIIVQRDQLIELATLGVLASCGISEVPVYKKLKVGLISTGNELVSDNVKQLEIGQIYEVNSKLLKKAIENTGASVEFFGILKDDFNELKRAIDETLEHCDLVILSGGTSKGEGDLGPKVLDEYKDKEILVHGVRIKPGKPIIFTKFGKKMIFILPGFPTSALSCFYVFIENFLRKNTRHPLKEANSKQLEVGERIYSTVGRHEFKPVQIKNVDGVNLIFPVKTGSEAISTMFYADGYVEIEELVSIVEEGEKKRVYYF